MGQRCRSGSKLLVLGCVGVLLGVAALVAVLNVHLGAVGMLRGTLVVPSRGRGRDPTWEGGGLAPYIVSLVLAIAPAADHAPFHQIRDISGGCRDATYLKPAVFQGTLHVCDDGREGVRIVFHSHDRGYDIRRHPENMPGASSLQDFFYGCYTGGTVEVS